LVGQFRILNESIVSYQQIDRLGSALVYIMGCGREFIPPNGHLSEFGEINVLPLWESNQNRRMGREEFVLSLQLESPRLATNGVEITMLKRSYHKSVDLTLSHRHCWDGDEGIAMVEFGDNVECGITSVWLWRCARSVEVMNVK
jgi:hypothetical protein